MFSQFYRPNPVDPAAAIDGSTIYVEPYVQGNICLWAANCFVADFRLITPRRQPLQASFTLELIDAPAFYEATPT